jgi:fibronectin-binding autotransporter adhesin
MLKIRNLLGVFSLLTATTLLATGSAFGANYYWVGGNAGGDLWSIVGNWTSDTPGGTIAPPTANDIIHFDANASILHLNTIDDVAIGGAGTAIKIEATVPGDVSIVVDAALTLDNGPSGRAIDMTAAAHNLTLTGGTGAISFTGAAAPKIFDVALNRTLTITESIDNSTFLLTIWGDGNTFISGAISNTGGLTKAFAGTLTLSGINSYTGLTTVSAGKLNIQNNSALGTVAGITTVSAGASLQVQGNITSAEPLILNGGTALENVQDTNTLSGAITLATGAATIKSTAGQITLSGANNGLFALTFDCNTGDIVQSGVISNGLAPETVTKTGTGTLTLSAANLYAGLTTVSAGKLKITNADALGTVANGTNVAAGAGLQIQGTIVTTAEPLTLNGASALENLLNNNTWAGPISLGAASEIKATAGTLTLAASATINKATNLLTFIGGGNVIANGIISSSGGLTVSMTAIGNIVTLLATNTYSGTTTVNSGMLSTFTGTDIPDASPVNIAGAAGTAGLTLGADETIGDLSGTGNITLAANTLTVNQGTNQTYAGIIDGTGGLIKEGASALTLTGVNTYTGATTVNAGTLSFNAINTGVSAVTVNNAGTTLAGTGTIPGAVTMNTGTILAPGGANGTAVGILTINGLITFNGTSKYVMTMTGGAVDKIMAGNNLVAALGTPTIEFQLGYDTTGLVIPVTVIDFTSGGGTYTAFSGASLPAGFVVDAVEVGQMIRITAIPGGGAIPSLNQWGIIIAFILLTGGGVILMKRRKFTVSAG